VQQALLKVWAQGLQLCLPGLGLTQQALLLLLLLLLLLQTGPLALRCRPYGLSCQLQALVPLLWMPLVQLTHCLLCDCWCRPAVWCQQHLHHPPPAQKPLGVLVLQLVRRA
jgi:hypothetical protein